MVMFGGTDAVSNSTNDVWTFDLTSYAWNEVTINGTKPSARVCHSSILYDDQMVMFGGTYERINKLAWTGPRNNNNEAWSLNLTTYSWKELTTTGTKPAARYGHSSIAYNGKMVIYGGFISISPYMHWDTWTLDLTSYAWNQLTTTKTNNVYLPALWESAILFNGLMVVYGGHVPGSTFLDSVWTLDLPSNAWNLIDINGIKPSKRFGHSAIVYNGSMVMFGGFPEYNAQDNWYNDAWTLNLTTYTWTELDTSVTKPSGRYLQSSILHNKKMVMFGGNGRCTSGGDVNNCDVELDDVWTLSLGTVITTTTTQAPT